MRADRLVSILLLLQMHRRMTSRDLAERLEVSARTIHRDMETLSMAGVPVYAERGRNGGWVLPDDYRTELPGLTAAETQALFLAPPQHAIADLQLGGAAEAGLIKVLAALPEFARRDIEFVRERIYLDTSSWRPVEEETAHLSTLQAAIWQERLIHMHYRRPSGQTVERTVAPLGLVGKGSTWYLIALAGEDFRTYRVSRVQEVDILPEHFQRPEGFDLAAHWEASQATFVERLPSYNVCLRIAPSRLAHIRRAWRYARIHDVSKPDGDGWLTIAADIETLEEACANVLSLGPDVEVLEPEELRALVIERAQGLLARYGHAKA